MSPEGPPDFYNIPPRESSPEPSQEPSSEPEQSQERPLGKWHQSIDDDLAAVEEIIERKKREASPSESLSRQHPVDEELTAAEKTLQRHSPENLSPLEQEWTNTEKTLNRLGDHLNFVLQDIREVLAMLDKARKVGGVNVATESGSQSEAMRELQEVQGSIQKAPSLNELQTHMTKLQVMLAHAGGRVNEEEYGESIQRLTKSGRYSFMSRPVEMGVLVRTLGGRTEKLLAQQEQQSLDEARETLRQANE